MQGPLVGAQPAQLAVTQQVPGEAAEVGDDLLDAEAYGALPDQTGGVCRELVSMTDGDGETLTFGGVGRTRAAAAGAQHHVGRGVVGRLVHRIGTVQVPGGGETQVDGLDVDDSGAAATAGRADGTLGRRGDLRTLPEARISESSEQTVYQRIYDAERPELFFKAVPWRVVTHGEPIAVRADSPLNVPEPELGLVVNRHGETVGYLVVNDVSSRTIEGENPLYLPQAKVYAGSCAVSTAVVPVWEVPNPPT